MTEKTAKEPAEPEKVRINDNVLLSEFVHLADFWQGRALVHAQRCAQFTEENAMLKGALEALSPAPDGDAADGDGGGA